MKLWTTRMAGVGLAGIIAAFTSSYSVAAKPSDMSFTHGEWNINCDNTLTCRAAGDSEYSLNAENQNIVEVILTRAAGPSTPVTNRVVLSDSGDTDPQKPAVPELLINQQSQGKLQATEQGTWQMDNAQFTAFMQALQHSARIIFRDNLGQYPLSSSGSSAVLLRMDDIQGRIDTPGALIKKGNRDETSVKAPLPVPEIKAAKVIDAAMRPMTDPEQKAFAGSLKQIVKQDADNQEESCADDLATQRWSIARLDASHSLVSATCWSGAYNEGRLWYVLNPELNQILQRVTYDSVDYDSGVISGSFLGNSMGITLSSYQQVWDGQRFVDSENFYRGLCALHNDIQACEMPLIVSKVIPAK
ncbi:DUF1176 domain-containing protein [Pantoea sp. A4]|uniref:DUF1176 domain-containing protein n=1 Tax=Pantoea sp. A4 TaxID=1225184 RepID=UPI00036AC654|nr:DUF1176 domain-containing protein [Pantoea sp. A4]